MYIIEIIPGIIDFIRQSYIIDIQNVKIQYLYHSNIIMNNIVDGLSDIQANNIQAYQLHKLDENIINGQDWLKVYLLILINVIEIY